MRQKKALASSQKRIDDPFDYHLPDRVPVGSMSLGFMETRTWIRRSRLIAGPIRIKIPGYRTHFESLPSSFTSVSRGGR